MHKKRHALTYTWKKLPIKEKEGQEKDQAVRKKKKLDSNQIS